MGLVGRLARRNPGYVLPQLRKTLIQMLTELQFSREARNRCESSMLLGALIESAHSLIKPYVSPILNVLLPKLADSDTSVASAVLATLGKLAAVGGEDIRPYLDELMPLIVNMLQNNVTIERNVALRTLSELVESTGYVVSPFEDYKDLLPTILNLLKTETEWSVRREVIRVLGVLGALDPYRFRRYEAELRRQEATEAPVQGTLANDGTGDDHVRFARNL